MRPLRLLVLSTPALAPVLAPVLAAVVLAATLTPVTAAAEDRSGGQPVLGSVTHSAPAGKGWGKARPRHLYDGGDPSGEVARLTWRHWGAARATGRGVTWLLRPEGGYYARPGRIVLRAERLGACADGAPAYTRLEFRVAPRPGAPVGRRWHPWAGDGDIC